MAVPSGIVSIWIGIGIARDGYILVNGQPSKDFGSICTAVGTPLLGVAIGLALFYLVPKVRRDNSCRTLKWSGPARSAAKSAGVRSAWVLYIGSNSRDTKRLTRERPVEKSKF